MLVSKMALSTALLAATLALSACESVEDKAERKYQDSLELAASGDVDRAIIELKNVFKLDNEHRDARMFYADLQQKDGNYEEAFGHYLLVAEQYPNDFQARYELAVLAGVSGNWDEARRHAEVGVKVEPDDLPMRAVMIAVEYNAAVDRSDDAAAAILVREAEELLETLPGDRFARQVAVDSFIRAQEPFKALASVDEALALVPADPQFNQIKLTLLAQAEDVEGLGEHLKSMVTLFPDNQEVRIALVRWYLANDAADEAEEFVRGIVATSEEAVPARVGLVQFLAQVRGTEAAIDELDLLIAEGLDDTTFRLMKASLVFDSGEREEAISQLETLVAEDNKSEALNGAKTTLARMLVTVGRTDEAKSLVEAVLEEDNQEVQALKLKATWLIEDDQVRDAVLALRSALDQSPRDAEAITLLARAYERDGNRELMADSLALAVEASGNAAPESLRYANYLIQNEKFLSAEDILLDALRRSPRNTTLLQYLGRVYTAMSDWPRAEQTVQSLERIGTDEANNIAAGLQATILQRLARTDESIDILRSVIREGQPGLAAQAAIIRTHLANGEVEPARTYMNELLASAEGSEEASGIYYLNAALLAVEGEFDEAEQIYRNLIEEDETREAVWRALIAAQIRQGKEAEAEETLDNALVALPDSSNLLWIMAGLMEREGKIEDAIDIYQALYEKDSNSTIIANNYASLITTYRDDDQSLQQAYRIARRLRGTQVPAFQDTYGWIAYRLGNLQEAIDNLEPAARGLPQDPIVQFHLAKVYIAAGRTEEAIPYLERAVQLWADSTLPLAAEANEDLRLARAGGASPSATTE